MILLIVTMNGSLALIDESQSSIYLRGTNANTIYMTINETNTANCNIYDDCVSCNNVTGCAWSTIAGADNGYTTLCIQLDGQHVSSSCGNDNAVNVWMIICCLLAVLIVSYYCFGCCKKRRNNGIYTNTNMDTDNYYLQKQ